MSADKLTDEQRRARALSIEQAMEKIKAEYGPALAALGVLPMYEWISLPSVEQYVEAARQRGIELDPTAMQLRRELVNLIHGSSAGELRLLVAVLSRLLEFNRLPSTRWDGLIGEIISVLSSAEMRNERREREVERHGGSTTGTTRVGVPEELR